MVSPASIELVTHPSHGVEVWARWPRAISRAITRKSRHHHDHQQFQEALAKILMIYSETLEHNQIHRSSRTYYVYCWKNQLNWQSKLHQQQSFETDITNIESQFQRSSTQWECEQCDVSLCKTENCWWLWHEKQKLF